MLREIEFVQRAYGNGVDATAVFDEDLIVRYWDPQMVRLTGAATESTIGRHFSDILPRAADGPLEHALWAALRGETTLGEPPFQAAFDSAAAHGYDWLVQPLCRNGNFVGSALVARATSTRASLVSALGESEHRFRAMADSSPVLLWLSERDGMCTFFNATWLAFSGRTMEQEVGVGWAEGVHPEDFEQCMNTYMDAFTTRVPFEMEYRLRRHDGQYRWILDRGVPRLTPDGDFTGFVGSCVDITDRRHAEEAVRAIAEDLKHANEHLSRLLYAASHDLREPLRSIMSFASLVEQRSGRLLHPDDQRHLGRIMAGAGRLHELIEGLAAFLEQRKREVPRTLVELDLVVSEVIENLASAIVASEASINIEPLPATVGDHVALRSVFQNLVENSLKFRRANGVRVHVYAEADPEAVVVSVRDDGIGFEPERADRIFEMFRRLHPHDRYEGSGVGLTIAHDVVLRHGGRIFATAEPGRGACFSVRLPRAARTDS